MRDYIILDSADSTNNYAKSISSALIRNDTITVVRAIRQSGGRGRGGGGYFSDHSGGLWVSIIVPIADISDHFKHNRAVSLAVADALRRVDVGAPIAIKWPNDIYWGDKKIAGILLENAPDNSGFLIIGLGLNVNIPAEDFPTELRDIATSVFAQTGRTVSLDELLEDILAGYGGYVGGDQAAVHKLYSDSLYKKSCRAAVNQRTGTFDGVEEDGRLRLKTDCGYELIMSGTLRFL